MSRFLFGCVGGWSNSHVGLWLCCGFGVHVGLPKDGETSAGELGAEGESETPVRGRGPLLRSNCKKSNVALWLVGLVVARFMLCSPLTQEEQEPPERFSFRVRSEWSGKRCPVRGTRVGLSGVKVRSRTLARKGWPLLYENRFRTASGSREKTLTQTSTASQRLELA